MKEILGCVRRSPPILQAKLKVRLLLHPNAKIEVQALPAPVDAGKLRRSFHGEA